jgi:hypothetical protein
MTAFQTVAQRTRKTKGGANSPNAYLDQAQPSQTKLRLLLDTVSWRRSILFDLAVRGLSKYPNFDGNNRRIHN